MCGWLATPDEVGSIETFPNVWNQSHFQVLFRRSVVIQTFTIKNYLRTRVDLAHSTQLLTFRSVSQQVIINVLNLCSYSPWTNKAFTLVWTFQLFMTWVFKYVETYMSSVDRKPFCWFKVPYLSCNYKNCGERWNCFAQSSLYWQLWML